MILMSVFSGVKFLREIKGSIINLYLVSVELKIIKLSCPLAAVIQSKLNKFL